MNRRSWLLVLTALLGGCPGTDTPPPPSGSAPSATASSGALPAGQATDELLPFLDDAGRTVRLPRRVRRVYPAGPPAMVLAYVVARDTLVGWPQELPQGAAAFIPSRYLELPQLGRLTGRGGTASVESVIAAHPDLVLDYGTIDATSRSLADRIQAQTGIPCVLLDGSFDRMPDALRRAGLLLGDPARGERLASAARGILEQARRQRAATPPAQRPRLYLARGPAGLETGGPGCINAEVLERVAAVNVAGEGSLPGAGLRAVSFEDVLRWRPGWVVTGEVSTARALAADTRWAEVEAVRAGRLRLAPTAPFGWLDRPPSVNRLLGVQWLSALLRPPDPGSEAALRAAVADFYRLFYQHAPSAAELDALLQPPERR